MEKYFTLERNEPFEYEWDSDGNLRICMTNKKGAPSLHELHISAEDIKYIKMKIKSRLEIPMGASRDNPPSDSLGYMLRRKKISPQQLCYVIPLLAREGFCNVDREGNAIIIKYNEFNDND